MVQEVVYGSGKRNEAKSYNYARNGIPASRRRPAACLTTTREPRERRVRAASVSVRGPRSTYVVAGVLTAG
jgi:hypothetical protein